MLSVVIIDDEALVRIGLKSMINWEEHGFRILAEASNGQQGLEVIRNYKPDIVITDIKMPVMDGIEMIREVKGTDRTKFIILSSYDEFHLARQGIKLGVIEYLIKLELEPETLLNAMLQAKSKILEEQAESIKKGSLERHVRANKPVLREEFFRKLIGRVILDRKELDENIRILEIELSEEILLCAFIKTYETENLKKFDAGEMQLFDFSVTNIIEEILNDTFKGYAFKWGTGEYVAIFSDKAGRDKSDLEVKTAETAVRLIQMLKQYFNISVSIGISGIHHGFEALGKAFLESSRALQHGFYKGRENYVFFAECEGKQETGDSIQILNYKNRLKKAFELTDSTEIKSVFKEIVQLLTGKDVTREKAFDVCCQIVYLVNDLMGDEGILNVAMGQGGSIYAEISKQNTLSEIIRLLQRFGEALSGYLENNLEQQGHRLISKAKKYINAHMKEEIKLNELADFLGLSPGYLSTLFKRVARQNFKDYVTEVKINHAKKLLKESNLKIYEISELLGYENAYYFSRVFRKVAGITPSEFVGTLKI